MGKQIWKNTEPVVAGFFIGIPYGKDTPEYSNVVDMLEGIWAQNHKTYLIEECLKCAKCGAINRTVQQQSTGLPHEEDVPPVCDDCYQRYYEG